MTKIYDEVIINPPEAETPEESDKWQRLVFLRANNEFIGIYLRTQLTQYVHFVFYFEKLSGPIFTKVA